MSARNLLRRSEAGELRPSQLLSSFGVGSLIDLPSLSVIVLGLDDWDRDQTSEIREERLLAAVRAALGEQVRSLRTPPRSEEPPPVFASPFDETRLVGVPVAPFPRWLVCSKCRHLAPIESGLFTPKVEPYRPDRTRYVHGCTTQGRPPAALPARFITACMNGHLDDFPWVEFVHRGATSCAASLRLRELGASGEAADVEVRCDTCDRPRRMAEAFGKDNVRNMPACAGRRPHLRDRAPEGCPQPHVRPMLQGASGTWYPVSVGVLALPEKGDALGRLVEEHWMVLEKATSVEVVKAFRAIDKLKGFGAHNDKSIWEAIERRRAVLASATAGSAPDTGDVKADEWPVLSNPSSVTPSRDFQLSVVKPPARYESLLDSVVLVERLRMVRALIGFTRIESPIDFDSVSEIPPERRAPLSRRPPAWVPAAETRGEGIFLRLREDALQRWESHVLVRQSAFLGANAAWRTTRGLSPDGGFPGIRYVLLHTLSHALLRQLAIECGYTIAALAERIYCRRGDDGEPQAGVLIYTAAPDSEGTLGGLSSLARPDRLGRHLEQALEKAGLCASDPLCAEHQPGIDGSLHGAACHACAFLPETSCERGNRFLDRSLLVATVEETGLHYFAEEP